LCYPSVELADSTITFAYNHDKNTDLSSPFIFTLAKKTGIPADSIAKQVMACFYWDEKYVIPDPGLNYTISSGYLNFAISPAYLIEVVKELTSFDSRIEEEQVALFPEYIQRTLKKGILFIRHTPWPENIQYTNLPALLSEKIEHSLLVLLAISEPRELHSSDAALFLLRTICSTLENYVKKNAILTNDRYITEARIILFRAVHNRIISLCRFYYPDFRS